MRADSTGHRALLGVLDGMMLREVNAALSANRDRTHEFGDWQFIETIFRPGRVELNSGRCHIPSAPRTHIGKGGHGRLGCSCKKSRLSPASSSAPTMLTANAPIDRCGSMPAASSHRCSCASRRRRAAGPAACRSRNRARGGRCALPGSACSGARRRNTGTRPAPIRPRFQRFRSGSQQIVPQVAFDLGTPTPVRDGLSAGESWIRTFGSGRERVRFCP